MHHLDVNLDIYTFLLNFPHHPHCAVGDGLARTADVQCNGMNAGAASYSPTGFSGEVWLVEVGNDLKLTLWRGGAAREQSERGSFARRERWGRGSKRDLR